MMRRKNTSRRVQALSSDSIRSDEIAATVIALSRDGSRDGISDMPTALHGDGHGEDSWPLGAAKSIGLMRFRHLRQVKAAVTKAMQGGRMKAKGETAAFRRDTHMAIKFGRPIEMRDAPPREAALASSALDLKIRPRRNRKAEWARRLVRENVLTSDDLIWPLFLVDGHNKRAGVASMPGVDRLSVDQAVRDAERAVKLNI